MFIQKQNRNISSPLLQLLAMNEFDGLSDVRLQQLCVERIKIQRQKIEELNRTYQLQKEIGNSKNEQIKKLKQIIQQLQIERNYQQAYEELKTDYEEIAQQLQVTKYESEHRISSQKSKIQELLRLIQDKNESQKKLVEQMSLLQNHWTNLINEKEEETLKIKHQSAEKITEQKFRNKQLKDQISQLKHLYSIKREQRKSTERSLRKSSKAKQLQLEQIKKTLKRTQSQCSRYRLQQSSKENSWKYEREELNDDIKTLNMCIKSLRKELTQKILEIESLKESLKRQSQRCMTLEQKRQRFMQEIKDEMNRQRQVKKRRQIQGVQIRKLQLEIQRLRKQNVKHIEDYNILQMEYNRAKMEIEKKQSSWKTCNKLSRKIDSHS